MDVICHARNVILKLFTRDETDYISSLCDDIMVHILCNLSVESLWACKLVCPRWYSLISSEDFVKEHLKRVKPMSMVLFNKTGEGCQRGLFLIDDLGKTSKVVRVRIPAEFQKLSAYTVTLHGSCNGALLLTESRNSVLYNPWKEKIVTVDLASEDIIGLFFDKFNKEYKIILYSRSGEHTHYSTYGLRTRQQKELGSFMSCPMAPKYTSCVNLPMGMCWIVYSHRPSGYAPLCHNSILVFEFDTERLYSISDPRGCQGNWVQEQSWTVGFLVRLLVWDDKLVFLQYFGDYGERVVIWVLEDFENGCWVQRQEIKLLEEFKHLMNIDEVSSAFVQLLNIIDDELLVKWPDGLFWYNLKSKMIRRIKTKHGFSDWFGLEATSFTHIDSIVFAGMQDSCLGL